MRVKHRALPDIMSGQKVQQIFKIRTGRKPDVFLPGLLTLKKNQHFSVEPYLVKHKVKEMILSVIMSTYVLTGVLISNADTIMFPHHRKYRN